MQNITKSNKHPFKNSHQNPSKVYKKMDQDSKSWSKTDVTTSRHHHERWAMWKVAEDMKTLKRMKTYNKHEKCEDWYQQIR